MKAFQASINTLNAGWIELRLAKLFGKKSTHQDSGCIVTLSKWRGKFYLINSEKVEEK